MLNDQRGHWFSWVLFAVVLFYLGYLLQPKFLIKKGRLEFDTGTRKEIVEYRYYVPRIPPGQRVPVVITIGGTNAPAEVTAGWIRFGRRHRAAVLSLGFTENVRDWQQQRSYQFAQAWSGRALLEILDNISREHPVDTEELYLSGLSAGAQFVVRFALWKPHLCRAVAAHSAGAYDLPLGRLPTTFLVTMGERDKSRMPGAVAFVDTCRGMGMDIRFTIFPDFGHGDRPEQSEMSRALFAEIMEETARGKAVEPPAEPAAPSVEESLIQAVRANDGVALSALLEAGGDVNAQTALGYTLLMEASALGHKEAAKILLERGADTSRRSPDGETAASLAQKNYRTEIQALLANTPSRPTPKVVFTDK